MEYASGGSLAEKLGDYRRHDLQMEIEQSVQIGIEIANRLAQLHINDVVHRDLKPTNILFDENGHVKIADLGVAQTPWALTDRTNIATYAPSHPGTPGYKSPEQETTQSYLKNSSVCRRKYDLKQ